VVGVAVCALLGAAVLWAATVDYEVAVGEGGAVEGYVVATTAAPGDELYAAAQKLADYRGAGPVVRFAPYAVGSLEAAFRQTKPSYVAFVVPPELIEANWVAEVFALSTRMNDDPHVDFGYGFITGRTSALAMELVDRAIAFDRAGPSKTPKIVGVSHKFDEDDGMRKCVDQGLPKFLEQGWSTAQIRYRDEDKETWPERRSGEAAKLQDANLVLFIGHGMGTESCGVTADDIRQATLDNAVVFNGTCHSAVTTTRWDVDPQIGGVKPVPIDPADSLPLALLERGAVGIFGKTTTSGWMAVGGAVIPVSLGGERLGDAMRANLNALLDRDGATTIALHPYVPGQPLPFTGLEKPDQAVESCSRIVLLGDPALRPFAKVEQAAQPVVATQAATADALTLERNADGTTTATLRHDRGAVDDAMIIAYLRTTPYGGLERIEVGNNGGGARILIGVHLADIPLGAGADISSAELRLYCYKPGGNADAQGLNVLAHRMTRQWTPASAWSGLETQPNADDFWDAEPVCVVPYDGQTGWKSFDITAPVREWATAPDTNLGLLIRFDAEDMPNNAWSGWSFASSENQNPDWRPRLVVTYRPK